MDAFPGRFRYKYQFPILKEPYSRENVHVIMRLDPAKLDPSDPKTKLRPDHDFPIVYSKMYGKGGYFSPLRTPRGNLDDPRVQKMYLEAIKWAMGLTQADITPGPCRNMRRKRRRIDSRRNLMRAVRLTIASFLIAMVQVRLPAQKHAQKQPISDRTIRTIQLFPSPRLLPATREPDAGVVFELWSRNHPTGDLKLDYRSKCSR